MKLKPHKGPYIKYDRNFLAFFDPLPPSDCKMTSLLLNSMMSLLLILTAIQQPPPPWHNPPKVRTAKIASTKLLSQQQQ